MECPICGQVFDDEYMQIADNGNLICCHCAEKETDVEEEE